MNVLGVILARGGSTRIPDKNRQLVGSFPLVAYSAIAARDAGLTRVVVSTDDARIASDCEPFGASWIRRPSAISGADATIEDAVQHALHVAEQQDGVQYDYVVALQAAVPIRPIGAIRGLLNTMIECNARGGVTAVRRAPWMWSLDEIQVGGQCSTWWNPREGYPRSQDVQRTMLQEINSIQITPRAEALAGKRWGAPLVMLELPPWADHDIDNPEDLQELRDDWPGIASRMERMRYQYESKQMVPFQWHMVCHPNVPKVQIPPVAGMHALRSGVILGNGPQIDELPKAFFEKIRSPWYVSIGVNRICCSENCVRHDFAPDLHLVWDSGTRGNPLTDAQIAGLERIKGRSWRMISDDPYARCYPHDQILEKDTCEIGETHRVKLRNVSPDAAVNVLYRMGIREIYLYGVEMNDNRHCRVAGLDESETKVPWDSDDQLRKGLDAWKEVMAAHEGAQLFCASHTSKLVTEGIMPFREIDTGKNYQ